MITETHGQRPQRSPAAETARGGKSTRDTYHHDDYDASSFAQGGAEDFEDEATEGSHNEVEDRHEEDSMDDSRGSRYRSHRGGRRCWCVNFPQAKNFLVVTKLLSNLVSRNSFLADRKWR